jgi:hypothetical protein
VRSLLVFLLLTASSAVYAGETCSSLVGPVSERARNRERRLATVEKVEVDALGARVIYTAAPLDEPAPFRPRGLELVSSGEGRAVVRLGPSLTRVCKRAQLDLLVDDAIGRGLQIVHVDDRGALILKDDKLLWWGEPPPRFQMIWRSSFAMDVYPLLGYADVAFDFGRR